MHHSPKNLTLEFKIIKVLRIINQKKTLKLNYINNFMKKIIILSR